MQTTPPYQVDSTVDDKPPGWPARAALLAVNGLAFQLAYSACNAAAQRAQVTRHLATAWDAQVPLVPWMVLPYFTSVPLLMLGFVLAVDRQALRAYSQRLLLTTALGCLVFALWPLSFRGTRPVPDAEPWSTFYGLLHALDGPFNQCPSLHVAYMVVLWPTASAALHSAATRSLLALWLLLVAAATVLTHQHHLVDVPAGVLLGLLACRWVPAQRRHPAVTLHYTVASLLSLVLVLTLQPWWARSAAAWLALCTAAVAWAYWRDDARFLHKRDGHFPLWVLLLYGPYLAGYGLTWALVRWRERQHPPVRQWGTHLWVGRRLSPREAAQWLPPQCVVVDLANELAETPALRPRPGRHYHAVPLLDLRPVPDAARAQVTQLLQEGHGKGRPVFLHCAMGYSRSRELAQQFVHARDDRCACTQAPPDSIPPAP